MLGDDVNIVMAKAHRLLSRLVLLLVWLHLIHAIPDVVVYLLYLIQFYTFEGVVKSVALSQLIS